MKLEIVELEAVDLVEFVLDSAMIEIAELEAALFVLGSLLVGFGKSELRTDTVIDGLAFFDSGSGIAELVPVLDSRLEFHFA